MKGIWLPNIKQWLTGTTISPTVQALDVNVANASLPINLAPLEYKEHRHMDFSVTTLPASAGVAVEIGDTNTPAANVANTCTELRVANNSGNPVNIYSGPNSGALTQIGVAHAGQIGEAVYGVSLVAGDKIWVRAIQNSAGTSGKLLVTLLGA